MTLVAIGKKAVAIGNFPVAIGEFANGHGFFANGHGFFANGHGFFANGHGFFCQWPRSPLRFKLLYERESLGLRVSGFQGRRPGKSGTLGFRV